MRLETTSRLRITSSLSFISWHEFALVDRGFMGEHSSPAVFWGSRAALRWLMAGNGRFAFHS